MKWPRLSVDPLIVALLIPAALFGYFFALMMGFVAVIIHELAHILAARLFAVGASRIELTPFGGLASMDSAPTPAAAFFIALAGPLANLSLVQALLLIYPGQQGEMLRLFILSNLCIGLFNLLPAYPLDGGRMLHVLLTPLLGHERAKRFGCTLGMVLGAGLLAFAIWSAVSHRVVNISLFAAGFLILVLARRQQRTDVYTALRYSQRKRAALRRSPIPAKQIAAGEETMAVELLRTLKQGEYVTACVVDEGLRIRGVLDETQILDGIVRFGSTCTLKKILDHQSGAHVN